MNTRRVKTSYRSNKSEFWQNKKRPKKSKNLKRKFFLIILGLALLTFLSLIIFIAVISQKLPNPNQLIEREVAQSTKIYDRTGEHILYEIHGEEKRTLIGLEQIPDIVSQASIAIEDKNFYKHGGFSVWAMARTMVTNIIYRRKAGGSTLTQQLVKNAILSSEKSYIRKIKEVILSQKLEKKFSKNDILQMYLNEIPYGSNTYGVEAASQKFFGKSVVDINLAEAALLAALPQAPSRYSPYGNNKDLLLGRKDYILNLMAEQGFISEAQRDAAKAYEIVFERAETSIVAPHFVMMIKSILSEKYGEREIERGGLKIYTTINWDMQKEAEELVKEKTLDYEEKYQVNNASLVSIDPKTGQVLALVGSRNYFNNEIDGQVNVADRPRQPGSSMKPIVYASLFEKGYTPNTILYDVITNFSTDRGESYTPRNYTNDEHGPVSIRKALAGSLNIPAVKAMYLAGINNVLNLTDNLNYTTLFDRNRYGLSLVLGGGEVKLLEHTNAFSVFANEGKINKLSYILKIEDKNGKILEEYNQSEEKVLKTETVQMINSILTDNDARSFIFGSSNWLTLGNRPVAAKTGTTNDYRDAWIIGYTPSLVTGVWVGNTDNSEMKRGADGSILAAPIWNEFMKNILADSPVENFSPWVDKETGKAILDGSVEYEKKIFLNKETGLPADDDLEDELKEEISIFNHHSILYYINKDDPLADDPENPEKDPQFNAWEEAILKWAEKNEEARDEDILNQLELIKPENKPSVMFISPSNGDLVKGDILEIKINIEAPREIKSIKYSLNNIPLLSSGIDKEINVFLDDLDPGYQQVHVYACDDVGNCAQETINFNYLK